MLSSLTHTHFVSLQHLQKAFKYSSKILDHFKNPQNVGKMDTKDESVGTGIVGAPACGDVMKLQLKFDESGKVVDAKFKTFGCGAAVASSSLATEWVKGKSAEECLEIKNKDIANYLSLPPVKLHCSMLAEDAIKKAIDDYKSKKTKAKPQPEKL